MENGKELTYSNEQIERSHNISLDVRFLESDTITRQEIDLVIAAFEDLINEMQRMAIAQSFRAVSSSNDALTSSSLSNPCMRTAA